MTLGQTMMAWRQRDGATLRQAWKSIGVPEHDARRYERGERVPRQVACAIRLVGIARLYGCPVFGRGPR